MNHRRIRKLPQRAGKQPPGTDAISGGSLDFVDLASQHRSQEDRKEIEALARAERLRVLRDRRRKQIADDQATAHGADQAGGERPDSDSVQLFEADQRERRVFSTAVQQEIASINTRRIRWFERGGLLAAGGAVAFSAVLLLTYIARSDRDVEESKILSPAEELALDFASHLSNAKRVARKFVLAESHEERLKYVRYPAKVAELMFKDRSMDWGAPLPFAEVKTYALPLLHDPFFIGCYIEDENENQYPVAMEIRPDEFLIDWEAFAEYNEVPWETVIDERSPLKDYSLRVAATLDDYYHDPFTADAYTCIHIQNRDRTSGMHAYAPKKGRIESEIKNFLTQKLPAPGADPALTTLMQIKIRFHEQETPRPMAEITSYVAPHWFTIAPQEDESSMVNPRAMLGEGSDGGVPLDPTSETTGEAPLAPKGSWRN